MSEQKKTEESEDGERGAGRHALLQMRRGEAAQVQKRCSALGTASSRGEREPHESRSGRARCENAEARDEGREG